MARPTMLDHARVTRIDRGIIARNAAFALLLATVLTLTSAPASAQVVSPQLWSTNGPVNALALSGNTLYIGGDFTRVGPTAGGGVPLHAATGIPAASFPKVAGTVNTAAPDGAGGWFIGGGFTHVGGAPRSGLAHILSDGSVSAWNPQVGGVAGGFVLELAVSNGTVYFGGYFQSVGGVLRNDLAAVDAVTGVATGWDPHPDGPYQGGVQHVVASGDTIYVAGAFTSIGGENREGLVALDATTGIPTSWNTGVTSALALAVSGGKVYVGGSGGAAAFDAITGAQTSWNPLVTGYVFDLSISGNTVFVAGLFASAGGQSRTNLAAISATTGLATPWNPNTGGGSISAMVAAGGLVYLSGTFTQMGGQARSGFAAVDAGSGLATAWNPTVSGPTRTLAVGPGQVYAGGSFIVGGVARNRVAALDVTTGVASSWDPGADGIVMSLAVARDRVYAGGAFTHVGGAARNHIAALDTTAGLADPWDPNASANVITLATFGDTVLTVLAGGDFATIGGLARNHLAALDAGTGGATPWSLDTDGAVRTLVVDGGVVYAGGSFAFMGGQSRHNLGAVDVATGNVTSWDPSPSWPVQSVAVSPGRVYVAGQFGGTIGGQTRGALAAVDATTGLALAWDPDPTWYPIASSGNPGIVSAVAVDGGIVYAGGLNFVEIGGQPRNYVAALDASTGLPSSWNPHAVGSVYGVVASGATVYVGGDFSGIGGEAGSGVAALRDSPTPVVLVRFEAAATSGGIRVRWEFEQPERVTAVTLERSTTPRGPWISMPVERGGGSREEEFVDRVTGPATTYYYRLTARFGDGTLATFGPLRAAMIDQTAGGLTGISPNPTPGSARINYSLARAEQVRIGVLDAAGREIVRLLDRTLPAGSYSMLWDGARDGRRLPAGVYFVRWSTGSTSMQRRVVLMP